MLLGLLLEFELTQLYSLGPTAVSLPGGGTDAKSELIIKYSYCLKESVADSTKFNRNKERKTSFSIEKA